MALQRLTGEQALSVIYAPAGNELQIGNYSAEALDADFAANGAGSMLQRAFDWTAVAMTTAGYNTLLTTGEELVNANRVQSYRVIIDALNATRFQTKFSTDKCEPMDVFEHKLAAVRRELCIALNLLGLSDDDNCFDLSAYIKAVEVDCGCTTNNY